MRSIALALSGSRWDERLSGVLLARGVPFVILAAIAIRWPDETVRPAMAVAAGIAVALGLLELTFAWGSRLVASVRWFLLGHAALAVGFGLLTFLLPSATVFVGLALAMLWLLAHTTFAILLAARLWYFRRMRDALLLWAAVNTAVITGCVTFTPPNVPTLEYVGALYTAMYGLVLIVAGEWTRRGWMAVERVPRRRA